MTRVIPVDAERTIAAGRWWSGAGPYPSYDTVQQILADLDRQLDATAAAARMAFAPIDVAGAESWPLARHGQAAVYSEVRIAIAPGKPERSLRSFFQWADVRFAWSRRQAPVGVVLEGQGVT